jgi:hypothetical protein
VEYIKRPIRVADIIHILFFSLYERSSKSKMLAAVTITLSLVLSLGAAKPTGYDNAYAQPMTYAQQMAYAQPMTYAAPSYDVHYVVSDQVLVFRIVK